MYKKILDQWDARLRVYPEERYGQSLINVLRNYPNIYNKIPNHLDCFYSESKISDFLLWLEKELAYE